MIELPQRLAGIFGVIGFLGALLLGALHLPSHYSVTLVLWRALILFLLFVGLGWTIGALVVCWGSEEEEDAQGGTVDMRFGEDPTEYDLFESNDTSDPAPMPDDASTESTG